MGAIRKDVPTFVQGQQSAVLHRKAEADKQEGWSVTSRPYRPQPNENLLDDLGSSSCDGCSCVLAGNRILTADGSLVPVEAIKTGQVIATMSGASRVKDIKRTLLGYTRKAIELHGIGDERLFVTDDHPLWVNKKAAGDGQMAESWGTYNLNHVLYEMNNTVGYELEKMPVPLQFDLPEQVAHSSGWLYVRPIYHHLDPATEVFHLITEEGFSFIAEGFALFSHCLNAQGPSTPWQGLAPIEGAAEFVRSLSLAE